LCGVWAEEIDVLHQDDRQAVVLVPDNALGLDRSFAVRNYADLLHLEGAEAVATYTADFYAGRPALTRRTLGRGEAWYLAAELEPAGLDAVVAGLAARAGLQALVTQPQEGLTVQARSDGMTDWLFALNFSALSRHLDLGPAEDAETGAAVAGAFELPPWSGRILRRPSLPRRQHAK
jgi:beta-galactosidase